MKIKLEALKAHALANTLFPPTTLGRAMERLKFVQADPIRAPARAQDLILRLRVKNYIAGDLERRYPKLGLEEDYLYAYGFMPAATWRLLHPRMESGLSRAEEQVLKLVSERRHLHPAELQEHLGRERELNAWGGYSKQTTRILQALHYRGLVRVAGRRNGIRLYAATRQEHQQRDAGERLKELILLIAGILSPIPERSLRATLQHLRHAAPMLEGRHSALTELILSGELGSAELDGLRYLWPAGRLSRRKPEAIVRFLSPFDPLIWDRRRFEHFWGWPYRFEAYTPAAKRERGYYAMPLLWRDDVVGWVNIAKRQQRVIVKSGFAKGEPKDRDFRAAFADEVERIRAFLSGHAD